MTGRNRLVSDAAEAVERFGDDECERFAARGPKCQLVGTDGNVFAVIGAVSKALTRAGQADRAAEWKRRAMACESYDAVLALVFEFVDPY